MLPSSVEAATMLCCRLIVCLTVIASALATQACQRLDPAPSNFSHLGPDWSGRCVVLYVSLSAQPRNGRVCGTEVFSAESSDLVTAAIHAGLFSGYSFAASTTVKFLPGQAAYRGSRRYGVASSSDCGRARLSFAFSPDQFPPPPEGPQELAFYSGMLATFSVVGASAGVVVGGEGGVYSQASAPGAAAVHAGLVRPGETRVLRFWYLPEHPGFVGSRRSGVAASSSREAAPALGFPDARILWGEAPRTLNEFRGADGATISFRLVCCGPRVFATVRGSNIYQVDSNFAASALHAGVVRPRETRVVEVEFVGKQDAFQASYRNGVMSEGAGRGDGYRFTSSKVV